MVHHIESQLNLHSCLIAETSVHQAVPEPWAQNKSIDSIAACDCSLRLQAPCCCLVYHVRIVWMHSALGHTLVVHMMLGVANNA